MNKSLDLTSVEGLTAEQIKPIQKLHTKALQENTATLEATFKEEKDSLAKSVREATRARMEKTSVSYDAHQEALSKLEKYENNEFKQHITKDMKDFGIKADFEEDVRDKVLSNIEFKDGMTIKEKAALFTKEAKSFCEDDLNKKYMQATGMPPLEPNYQTNTQTKTQTQTNTQTQTPEEAQQAYLDKFK